MQIEVNGEALALPATLVCVADLMTHLQYGEAVGVAVAVNGSVVPRTQWSTQPLAAGDRVDVVGAVQGG